DATPGRAPAAAARRISSSSGSPGPPPPAPPPRATGRWRSALARCCRMPPRPPPPACGPAPPPRPRSAPSSMPAAPLPSRLPRRHPRVARVQRLDHVTVTLHDHLPLHLERRRQVPVHHRELFGEDREL